MSGVAPARQSPVRIVFAGTPDFAVPSLQALAGGDQPPRRVVAVYTQPDRPAGRGRRVRSSEVKQLAERLDLPVEQPPTLRDEGALGRLRELRPDLLVVAAYGLILPQAVLDVPRLGCVNVHASLLPRWRGAAPVQRAMLAGDRQTGVTLMQMDAGLDTGATLATRTTPIRADDTGGTLTDRLARLGAALLADSLADLVDGRLRPVPQDAGAATLAPKIRKSEARIDWTDTAERIARQVRAFDPWPVAETRWSGRQLRIWSAHARDADIVAAPGRVLGADAAGIRVATGAGELVIRRLQPAGRRVMAAANFVNANDLDGASFAPGDGLD